MVASNTYGRQVVVPLTNKSGGGVIAGDVVVIGTANDSAFTTSTAGAFLGLIGIAQETIADNATGRVLTAGYAALVNVNASVTRQNFGKTHTVAKQAVDAGASRVVGVFCQFLKAGTTPDAVLFGLADASSATGNVATDAIWDAAGDLAVGTGANTAARLASGAAGTLLTGAGVGSAPTWAAAPVGYVYTNGATGDYTTTSTSFVDVDATNLSATLTTGAHRVLVMVTGSCIQSSAGSSIFFDINIDAARVGSAGGIWLYNVNANNMGLSIAYLSAVLSAGSHTIKLQWRVDATTGTLRRSATAAIHFSVAETLIIA